MNNQLTHKSLLVPFPVRIETITPTRREKRLDRAIKASLIAFLIAVALVSFVSNIFNEYEKKLRAANAACQASTQQPTNTVRGKSLLAGWPSPLYPFHTLFGIFQNLQWDSAN